MRRFVHLAGTAALLFAVGCNLDVEVGSDARTGTTSAGSPPGTSTTPWSAGGSATSTGEAGGGNTGGSTGGMGSGGDWICPPSPLVGMHWNGAAWHIARVDPTTGAVTLLDALQPSPKEYMAPAHGYDPGTKRVYHFLGNGEIEGHVFTTDGVTGAVLSVGPFPLNDVYNPVVNAAGEIIVLHFPLDGSPAETATMDPVTGALQSLSVIPAGGSYTWGDMAYDRAADRIYQAGGNHMTLFDGTTGASLGLLYLTLPGSDFPQVSDLIITRAGELLGITDTTSGLHTVRVDKDTGALTVLAPFPHAPETAERTYDPCTDRWYQRDLLTQEVYVINGTSGQTLGKLPLVSPVSHIVAVH